MYDVHLGRFIKVPSTGHHSDKPRSLTAPLERLSPSLPSRGAFLMTLTRQISIATGTLFLLATIAVLAAQALDPTLSGTGYLVAVAHHPHRQAAAALCYLVAAGASVSIALALYPLLKKVSSPMALGSVIFRAIEAALYTTAVVSLLSIPPLADRFTRTPAGSRAPVQETADALLSLRDHATLAGVFAFTLGALLYYVLFYRSHLVPRWLSGWGVAGVLLLLTACVSALFSNTPVTGYTLLIAPIAVQEIVLAVWLLLKGFNPTPHTSPEAHAPLQSGPGRARRLAGRRT